MKRAFTLIETLLVVALSGILVSLLLPAIARVRDSARDTVSLANLRSHAQVVTAYGHDWDDYYPAFADPDATLSVVRGCGRVQSFPYFEAVAFWDVALCEGYYNGILGQKSFRHPASSSDDLDQFAMSYFLSSAFMASPAYWRDTTRTGPAQWGPSRLSSVVFPSQKTVLVEVHPLRGLPTITSQKGIALSFTDGSAGRFNQSELNKPYRKGDGTGQGTWLPVGVFGMHTIDGWAGRDRK